jgi:hypothetical protein
MKLIAHVVEGHHVDIRPAPVERTMDINEPKPGVRQIGGSRGKRVWGLEFDGRSPYLSVEGNVH